MTESDRCSVRARLRSEPLYGTASVVRAFVLLEAPVPWGRDALRDARLPAAVLEHLRGLARRGVRPLLVRRFGGARTARTRLLVACCDPHEPWLESTELDDPEELLDLDLTALADGRSVGLSRSAEPVFLTCTHGRHDRCCAERGRPVAAALARSQPGHSWEVSHIGGDRFAGNVLVLPDGLYYGHLGPGTVDGLADRHRAGHLDLDHLRGRCGYGFAVQAAEWFLRTELGETGLRAVRLTGSRAADGLTEATFDVGDRAWDVAVQRRSGPSELLTCGAGRANPVPVHELIGVRAASGTSGGGQ